MELTKKQRTRKMLTALVMSFLTATFVIGAIVPDTVATLLANFIMMLSASGGVMMMASYNIVIIMLGVMILCTSFASFAGHSGNIAVTALGAACLFAYTMALGGIGAGVATVLCFLPAVAMNMFFGKDATYTEMVQMTTAGNLTLAAGSLVYTVVANGGKFSPDAIRAVTNSVILGLMEFYAQAAAALDQQQLAALPSSGYTKEAAMAAIFNNLPAIIICMAMLAAYWTTTNYMKANNVTFVRNSDITSTFMMSKPGAVVFVLASVTSWLTDGLYSAVALNAVLVQTLPCALVGITSLRNTISKGPKGLMLIVGIGLILYTPVAAIVFFIATYGALSVLFDDLPMRKGGSRRK